MPVGVAWRAKKQNVPVVALVGDVGAGYEELYEEGITAIFATNKAAVPYEPVSYTHLDVYKRQFLCKAYRRAGRAFTGKAGDIGSGGDRA